MKRLFLIDKRLNRQYNWNKIENLLVYEGSITMRLKKGFTLAEILIVLMVIGAIATMTIPSLMKGVTESQWKTAYKKAYNAVVNLTAMERIAGQLPSTPDKTGVGKMFQSLNQNLAVKDYAAAPASISDAEPTYTASQFRSAIQFSVATSADQTETDDGSDESGETLNAGLIGDISPWITTDDNISYLVTKAKGTSCSTKLDINSAGADDSAQEKACVIVVVDVNGLTNGPNKIEPQISSTLDAGTSLSSLTGDRYYIYIGIDGATAGSKKSTVTGRIVSDLK